MKTSLLSVLVVFAFQSLNCQTQWSQEDKVFMYQACRVYTDKYYGTLKSEVERIWKEGKVVIFDVDVKGGIRLKEIFGDKALSIFVMPPSIAELEQRLIKRNTDCAETIKTRVEKAGEEMTYQKHFDKIIVNTDLDTAKTEVEKIINNFINE